MTSITSGLPNPYAQMGSAYARAAATLPSLASTLDAADSTNPFDPNAATNLTLSDAARAQLANSTATKDFTTVTADARAALDGMYATANVTSPLDADGNATIDLSSMDRRSLFAIATNNGGKFTPDEQAVASGELNSRFNAALAPAASTSKLIGNYAVAYKAALDYLDGASPEEKATTTWAAQRAAVQKGYQATEQSPGKIPAGIAGDPVAAYLTQPAVGDTTAPVTFSDIAKGVRAALDAQQDAATRAGKELVFDPGRKTGQLADLSSFDNRSLSAIVLNQGEMFSNQEIYAAKTELNTRTRMSILSALQQGQKSGDPSQVSLGILNTYSSMSDEERQATNWTPAFRDTAAQSYKTASTLLSMLRGT
jgi:hypothetical protein